MNETPHQGYAPVNGLSMYYEVRGAGDPLILLHGGVVGIEMFGPNPDALATRRQVIAVELQGHGRTADIIVSCATRPWPTTWPRSCSSSASVAPMCWDYRLAAARHFSS